MRAVLVTVLSVMCCTAPATAHADTLFDVNVSLGNQDTVSGTVLLDTVNGDVVSGRVNAFDSIGHLLVSLDAMPAPVQGRGMRGFYDSTILFGDGGNDLFELVIQGFGVVGYTGGPVCPASLCYIDTTNLYFGLNTAGSTRTSATRGALTLATANSPVPEPSAVALLGTGLLGAVGACRRSFEGNSATKP